jgi:hypothetical protein
VATLASRLLRGTEVCGLSPQGGTPTGQTLQLKQLLSNVYGRFGIGSHIHRRDDAKPVGLRLANKCSTLRARCSAFSIKTIGTYSNHFASRSMIILNISHQYVPS